MIPISAPVSRKAFLESAMTGEFQAPVSFPAQSLPGTGERSVGKLSSSALVIRIILPFPSIWEGV